METDKGHDTLTLSVNQQELVLNEKNHSQEALTLSWTTGTNYGSGNRISYTLELAKAGTDFANAYSVDLGTGTYQWTKKVEELNQFLHTQFGIGYDVKAELEARITAVVAGMEDQKQIATTAFTVTTYQPVTTTLYLIGDATPNGWSADNATAMERTDNGQFTWTGNGSAVAELVDVERVADSSFVPSYVQANDHSDLGSFGVVRATLRVDGVDNGTVYAVIPDAALKNPSYMDMGSGLPAFDYSSWISFTCMTSEELDKQTEQEVIAILASFKVAEASDNASASKKSGEGSLSDPDGYVLSDSSSRTYSNAELEAMSDYELYLSRNEIFARHGRIFKNSDLQEYFGSKSWYDPRYTPEEFSESMLNANEKANIERMAKIEQDRNSPYID